MATGIQTGIRTGTGTVQTPRTGAPLKPGGPSGFAKLMQAWQKLDPKKKMFVIVGAIALVVLVFGVQFYSKATAYVPLYTQKLTPTDVHQIGLKLNEMKIPFASTSDQIMVSPADRPKAQLQLAAYGLPHKPVVTSMTKEENNGLTPQTEADKNWQRNQQLQGDLIETLRSIDGVADANVKLVIPNNSYFQEDGQNAKAAVMLMLQPNMKLSVGQIKGIVNLVSFSVEGLSPENVQIVDQYGRILNDPYLTQDSTNNPGVVAKTVSDQEENYSRRLENKVRAALDNVLGPDQYTVSVNASLDFSQSESTRTTYEKGADIGTKIKTEKYTNNPSEGGEQMAFNPGAAGSGKTNYYSQDKTINSRPNEYKVKNVRTAPIVQKITASVAVNNLKQDQVSNIKELVQGAIGYDASRGDKVSVQSMPFTVSMLVDEAKSPAFAAAYPRRTPQNNQQQYLLYAALLPMALLLIVATLFFLKQRDVQSEKSRLLLNTTPGTTVSDISDLLSDKAGHSAAAPPTKVNTTDQLEKLAKEKPTKVAELLKSTWLADKER